MIYLNVLLTANDPADADAIADALARAGELSVQEHGCERWEAYQMEEEPHRFLLVERWRTAADLDAHRTAEAYTRIYSQEVIPKVHRQPLRSKRIV